jgi:hypothetical protein
VLAQRHLPARGLGNDAYPHFAMVRQRLEARALMVYVLTLLVTLHGVTTKWYVG